MTPTDQVHRALQRDPRAQLDPVISTESRRSRLRGAAHSSHCTPAIHCARRDHLGRDSRDNGGRKKEAP